MKTIATGDGSLTFLNEELNETYHSIHGALGESIHVYIENGLKKLAEQKREITILEIGFGTGMNALLTAEYKAPESQVTYFTLEPYPLSLHALQEYYAGFSQNLQYVNLLETMLDSSNERAKEIFPGFYFKNSNKKLQDSQASDLLDNNGTIKKADLVYYDAFAPSKQADMWNESAIEAVSNLMADNAILVTYCAQGQFKRLLKARGFTIDTPKGAFGKREMTVARKVISKALSS